MIVFLVVPVLLVMGLMEAESNGIHPRTTGAFFLVLLVIGPALVLAQAIGEGIFQWLFEVLGAALQSAVKRCRQWVWPS